MKTRFQGKQFDFLPDDGEDRKKWTKARVKSWSKSFLRRKKMTIGISILVMFLLLNLFFALGGKDRFIVKRRRVGISTDIEGPDQAKPGVYIDEGGENLIDGNLMTIDRAQLENTHEDSEEATQSDSEQDPEEATQSDSEQDPEKATQSDSEQDHTGTIGGFHNLTSIPDRLLYSNYDELEATPFVKVPNQQPQRGEWWYLQDYIKVYRAHPIKATVPVLNRSIQVNLDTFLHKFRKFGQPVKLHFENLQAAGYKTRSYTLDELRAKYPIKNPEAARNFLYKSNAQYNGGELKLGPALEAISGDGELFKKKSLRNFPRNLQVRPDALKTISLEWPPLVPPKSRQRPSLWLGTSSSGTGFHHDCCDNMVMMISGSKRFTLAPPTDWYALSPKCIGKHKSLCYANIAEPNKPGADTSYFHKIVVDINPGEILYMPAGWFHHIENLGPVVMINFWTFRQDTCKVTCTSRRGGRCSNNPGP
eukprot:CAMPEP_0203789748 /NCGR_PEP_ID=MMETSP0100_2-20121128/3640_1 /ASSEMBLY_ACC=CAM_ASM_000210 /TAXON_ID=96639 /ORGANISM=" , Strain NY0313808BC1" /LENGTH=476 /DNA_ID=CAMNT_0050692767 /DNA_START=201 /DNA_END=1631 /DNA_ORIENTATION=+